MSTEKKYTEAEMKALADGIISKASLNMDSELSLDELDGVSGGVIVPKTHEEIDAHWDAVEGIAKRYGIDVASIYAYEKKLISKESTIMNKTMQECRQWMHNKLDGKNDDWTNRFGGL